MNGIELLSPGQDIELIQYWKGSQLIFTVIYFINIYKVRILYEALF